MKSKSWVIPVGLLMQIFIVLNTLPAWANKTPYDWAFVETDYACREKVHQLQGFMDRIHHLAVKAASDPLVVSFFEMNRHYENALESGAAIPELTRDIDRMRSHFNGYYIENYFVFYDLLFVDKDGSVFHTLRGEPDTHINLTNPKQSLGHLSDAIAGNPDGELFIDFYQYGPSSEPAAFFIEPIRVKGVKEGWVILQCPITKLNSIFSATDALGQTGETFLVNSDGLMLTESYFKGQSTILKERLDDRNIKVKFNDKKGRRVVRDYRGETALSSFEVFEFLGTQWLVVAKIDKDEVTTDHYKNHDNYYADQLIKYLNAAPLPSSGKAISFPAQSAALRVDMDEFLKADDHETLETWGVSTCTALLALLPQRFAYLAHISPKDRIYNNTETRLVSQITRKIKSFDIYPCERRDLVFIVIAPHLNSVVNVISKLTREGFLLSQIRIFYNSHAESAAVIYNYETDDLRVTWKAVGQKADVPVYGYQQALNAGKIIEDIMAAENNSSDLFKPAETD